MQNNSMCYEQAEARAFDRVADQFDRSRLVTTSWTFSRYRSATLGDPFFKSYPDLVFSCLGARFRSNVPEKPLRGIRVLDLGAGDGAWSVILAEQGADVVSVEISPKAVELARERMRIHHLSWDAQVWSAYRLSEKFQAGSFDLVFGQAVLHHLVHDLGKAYAELNYVLRSGGSAVFSEPCWNSTSLRSVREKLHWLFPLDRESPDERPLSPEELQELGNVFSAVEFHHFDVFEKITRRVFGRPSLRRMTARFDDCLLRSTRCHRFATRVFIAARK